MKFLFPVVLATFVAVAVAKDCSDLGDKVPSCSSSCVNNIAKKYCESKDFACSCSEEIFYKIVEESADCVIDACKGKDLSFVPLHDYCQCELGNIKPTTTAAPQPTETPSCDAEQKAIPDCAIDCLNAEGYEQCEDGDPECVCESQTLKTIVKNSEKCVAKACDGKVEVFKPLKNWCKCTVGDVPSTSTTSGKPTKTATTSEEPTETATTSEEPTETATTSEQPTETATTSEEPTETATSEEPTETATTADPTTLSTAVTTSKPVTLTSTFTITTCHSNKTTCATGEATETLTLTTTWCPEETDGPVPTGETPEEPAPTAPGPDTPIYPTTPGSPGTTYIPSATPVKPSQPTFEAAGVMVQQSSGFVAVVAVIVGVAWL
ncbi:hypothetical protein V493_01308 [Pseudogymnoascus sp. VKM F-4281 (FW-2241)]|nr:hypothetical protein V493_01308 [Pseudogymnoascus sp. VKM F-4281 (FW-2241)]